MARARDVLRPYEILRPITAKQNTVVWGESANLRQVFSNEATLGSLFSPRGRGG